MEFFEYLYSAPFRSFVPVNSHGIAAQEINNQETLLANTPQPSIIGIKEAINIIIEDRGVFDQAILRAGSTCNVRFTENAFNLSMKTTCIRGPIINFQFDKYGAIQIDSIDYEQYIFITGSLEAKDNNFRTPEGSVFCIFGAN